MAETTSRQVLKKRNGESVPIIATKRRRFNSILYFDSELKKLDAVLDENDIDLNGNEILFE